MASTGLSGFSEKALIDHYLTTPRSARRSPQPLFDAERYRVLVGLGSEVDAFLDFVLRRFERGDAMSRDFDVETYLRDNPDIRVAGLDATRHYLDEGWREGRLAPVASANAPMPDFRNLRGRTRSQDGPEGVDVIVPVYSGHNETLACLHSVLSAKTEVDYRLVVIDDASPEPGLPGDLASLAQQGLIVGFTNPRNLGFTATANRGLEQSGHRDVVLLNSDTEVYDGWLDRLRAHAYGQPNIGTVTPLSNAATILSYPVRLRDNGAPLELSYCELAELAGRLALPPVEIPTAIGFCMYIRRACLDEVGLFDLEAFPTGYGEENDFCMRAAAKGWRHLAATDTFVMHIGSKSFGARRAALVAAGLKTLERRHPGYHRLIDRVIAEDPLSVTRRELDIARVRRAGSPMRLVHGGSAESAGPRDLILRKALGRRDRLLIHAPWCPNTPNLSDQRPVGEPRAMVKLLRDLNVVELLVAESRLLDRAQVVALRKIAATMGIPYHEVEADERVVGVVRPSGSAFRSPGMN